jgi:hypothetical protein
MQPLSAWNRAEFASRGVAAASNDLGAAEVSEIRAELEKILESRPFKGSFRLTRFLKYVVETTLAGDARRIKAYTVGIEALGRDSHFDPLNDPIVRVQAKRLRDALARYYCETGSDDELFIELPRGTYVPAFRRRSAEDSADHIANRGGTERSVETARRRNLDRSLTAIGELVAIQRMQIALLMAQIEAAAVEAARLGVADIRGPAVLLRTTSVCQDGSRAPDDRDHQKQRPVQAVPAARPRRARLTAAE